MTTIIKRLFHLEPNLLGVEKDWSVPLNFPSIFLQPYLYRKDRFNCLSFCSLKVYIRYCISIGSYTLCPSEKLFPFLLSQWKNCKKNLVQSYFSEPNCPSQFSAVFRSKIWSSICPGHPIALSQSNFLDDVFSQSITNIRHQNDLEFDLWL